MRLRRDQHLAAEMAALLFRGELILVMHARRTGRDIGFHDLEAVERSAEAGLGVRHDRCEPVARRAAFRMLDLVGAHQRVVDLARQFGAGVRGIQRLVRIHRARGVGIGGDLPARKVDRLQPSADLLHRLVAAHCAERVDVILGLEQFPQSQRALAGERMLDRDRATQLLDVGGRIGADDAVEATRGGRNQIFERRRHVASFTIDMRKLSKLALRTIPKRR